MKFGRGFDLRAQVGRGSEQKPALRIGADGDLRLRAGFAVEGSGAQGAAVGAGTIPLGKTSAGGRAEDLDEHVGSVPQALKLTPARDSARPESGGGARSTQGAHLLSRGPGETAASQKMNVEVEDGLSGTGAYVEDGAVSMLDIPLAGDVGCGQMAAADDFGVGGFGFFQPREMLFGNDEHVRRRLRADVFEGEDMLIFVNFLGGNFSPNDAAEEAA